ncbi:glycosyltransferase family 2 protein [Cytophaga hutchinsonii]|uniref:B-glycosyltransferase-related protein, glycosyltransferase family 2 protein n=1 Tax=Cytophaga hutchinsonii (strain ATCC 33406 / DSM 1761 / CIP 103989 / NBRC 15051 / NCIMB 9469 / D465) TaxID=269798 RepID=A0A6N4SSQ9_CYTH3|nr:glycosyltransferase [Cytophaga hutchinsonii]ABG59445.1 b-glycosyltransferase-related protein, glycosyltransferase family 2 protein [Cytophaga hutchinsonii ATCC 33406]SFX96280.1 hypothetical protein SAMN04487930_11513 [Cytophaga hutchinsonii ATCC 33406]
MAIYIGICCLLYILFGVCLLIGWQRIQEYDIDPSYMPDTSVAVILPVRNEIDKIESVLHDLLIQEYPQELFTVYLVDDASTDGTTQVLQNWAMRYPDRFRMVCIQPAYAGWKGKKKQIASALAQSASALILTTDADCRHLPAWIKTMVYTQLKTQASFVSGPVRMQGEYTFWNKFQWIEFASLVGSGASAIGLQVPLMCNGANILYTREAYNAVGGFEGNTAVASGDDEFLMHKLVAARGAGSVVFCKQQHAVVSTGSATSWQEFRNQRKRWASKWEHYALWYVQAVAIWIFVFHFTLLVCSALALIFVTAWYWAVAMWATKIIFDYFYLKSVARFLSIDFKKSTFMYAVLIYPAYVIYFGLMARFGTYTWKERIEKHS